MRSFMGDSAQTSRLSPRTGTEDLCMVLGEPVLGSGAHTDHVLGRLGLAQLGRPSWVRGVVQACRLRDP